VRVHLAGKHALEFELLDLLRKPHRIRFDLIRGTRIRFGLGKLQKLRAVAQATRELVQGADDLLEFGALLAELLCPFRVVPDLGLL